MPYTVLVLQCLAVQFVLGFIAAGATANMGPRAIHWRRVLQRGLWGLTGWLLLAAIAWDVIQWAQT
jgi:hypothetical protein